ncbi:MAG: hypothetical protein AB1505_22775 [Candidatus Latescibacterota bacterium]
MVRLTVRDFRDCGRDRFVDATVPSAARLAPTYLLSHAMGVTSALRESLTPSTWARVEFELAAAPAQDALLLLYVNADSSTQQTPMHLRVNGEALTHRQDPQAMLTGGWDRCALPARLLRRGPNELVFSHSGVLHVDPFPGGCERYPASHSSRSFDAGLTWHTRAHGPSCDVAGEYLVNLRLRGYPPAGQLTSPVLDLADPEGKGAIALELRVGAVRLEPEQETPGGTAIRFELRSGDTPLFDPRCWTPWQAGTALRPAGRFLQWRATLTTEAADRTPVLCSLTLEADATVAVAPAGVRLVEVDQPTLARSSYPFTYLGPHPRQERLVKQYRLDEVIAAGTTELEQLGLLRDWVHGQWLGWQSDKYPYCPTWDPLEILAVTKGNWGYGMCTHYGATFSGCAAALGFVSRPVVVDHHCLAEVWSEDLQKWILEDAGPAREYDATYEVDGVPQNALELHRLLASGEQGRIMANKLPQRTAEVMSAHVHSFVRFGIPLRNDHLVTPEPAEQAHGATQYHWSGYLWWSDDMDPRFAEYPLQTTRPADLYWSVNQVRVFLQATARPGVLRVDLEHTAPNLDHFAVQVNDGPWHRQVEPRFEWEIAEGEATLSVRTVNRFGRQGRISRVRVQRRV